LGDLKKFQELRDVLTQKANARSSPFEEIEILRQYIGHTKSEVKEMEGKKQKLIIKKPEKVTQQDEEYAKLKERVPKLSEECQRMRQTVTGLYKRGLT
jgi:hypothetical protein